MRYKIVIKPKAETDLEDIWLYIAKNDLKAADKLIDTISNHFKFLAENPHLGVKRNELFGDCRMIVTGKYLTFYTINETNIDIIRVIHGARNFKI